MSGGHYGYAYEHLDRLVEAIEAELAEDALPRAAGAAWRDNLSETERWALVTTVKRLQQTGALARHLEWWRSGDTDLEDYLFHLREALSDEQN